MSRLLSLARGVWVDALLVGALAGLLSIAARAPDPRERTGRSGWTS